jgi:hypothetical protein
MMISDARNAEAVHLSSKGENQEEKRVNARLPGEESDRRQLPSFLKARFFF